MAETLERIRPKLPPTLVSEAALARVARMARRLPAPLTSWVYLERWLAPASSRVDLIVRVGTRGRALLAAPSRDAFDACLLGHPAWQRVFSFAREWERADSPLAGGVEGLWLEFDLPPDGEEDALPVPRVFVDFAREAYKQPSLAARQDLALEALRALSARGPTADRLEACLKQLPAGASMPYLGLSLSGRDAGLRLCVQGLGPDIVGYLDTLGWPGDGADLSARLLGPLARAKGDPVHSVSIVHLDLDPGLSARIGLEYGFARASQWRGHLEETALLEHLVEERWCSGAVRDALLSWPGRSAELLAHEIWHSRVGRRLSHVKLTYATGRPIEAKAYLCFFCEPLRGGTLIGTRPWLPAWLSPECPPERQPSAIG